MKDLFMIIGWSEMLLTREVKKDFPVVTGGNLESATFGDNGSRYHLADGMSASH